MDVTGKPFQADPTGKTDSTRAIQAAVVFARDHQLACFFPPGTYLLSDTLTCTQQTDWSTLKPLCGQERMFLDHFRLDLLLGQVNHAFQNNGAAPDTITDSGSGLKSVEGGDFMETTEIRLPVTLRLVHPQQAAARRWLIASRTSVHIPPFAEAVQSQPARTPAWFRVGAAPGRADGARSRDYTASAAI